MPKKKTHEEYKEQVLKINQNIIVVGQYINATTPIEHKCKKDGYIWKTTPNNILCGHGCPKCSGVILKTHDQYVQDLAEKNPYVTVIEQYINARTPILHKCLIDDYNWYIAPTNALKGEGCPICKKRKIVDKLSKDHNTYVEECENINPNIEVIGTYINASSPILHKCKLDGCEWMATPSNILNGTGCPRCANNIKRTHSEYILLLSEINPMIEVIGEYVDANTTILHYCKKHQIFWNTSPYRALRGCGCIECGKEKIGIKNTKEHKEYVNELYAIRDDIEVRDIYIDSKTPILHYCKKHKIEWMARPYNILMGEGCPMCRSEKISIALTKDNQWYVDRLKIVHPDIEAIDEYINYNTPIRHLCKKHNYEWCVSPRDVVRNNGCPKCFQYKREKLISIWLDNHNIDYISQYKFDDCRDKRPLPFDFYLPQYNACIEHDGRQHFVLVDFAGKGIEWAQSQLNITQYHDNIKNEYCKNNHINLLRISYFQDIEEELNNFCLS